MKVDEGYLLIESILEEDDENGREYHKAEYFIS
jgi:hypothetical protein